MPAAPRRMGEDVCPIDPPCVPHLVRGDERFVLLTKGMKPWDGKASTGGPFLNLLSFSVEVETTYRVNGVSVSSSGQRVRLNGHQQPQDP